MDDTRNLPIPYFNLTHQVNSFSGLFTEVNQISQSINGFPKLAIDVSLAIQQGNNFLTIPTEASLALQQIDSLKVPSTYDLVSHLGGTIPNLSATINQITQPEKSFLGLITEINQIFQWTDTISRLSTIIVQTSKPSSPFSDIFNLKVHPNSGPFRLTFPMDILDEVMESENNLEISSIHSGQISSFFPVTHDYSIDQIEYVQIIQLFLQNKIRLSEYKLRKVVLELIQKNEFEAAISILIKEMDNQSSEEGKKEITHISGSYFYCKHLLEQSSANNKILLIPEIKSIRWSLIEFTYEYL